MSSDPSALLIPRSFGRRTLGAAMVLVSFAQLLNSVARPLTAQEPHRVSTPREMLQIMQIDASQLGFFLDDRPVLEQEEETLLQLLFRLPRFAQLDLDRWARDVGDWDEVAGNLDSYRFEILEVTGTVQAVERLDVLPALARRLRFSVYYRLTMRHGDPERTSIIYTRRIPSAWTAVMGQGLPIVDEGARVQGLLLKRLRATAEVPSLVFAAPRVEWHPRHTNPAMKLTEDMVLLSQLGLDLSRLEEVEQRAAMEGADRECFYQTLAAVRQANWQQLAQLGRPDFDIAQLIRSPKSALGNLYALTGLARRAIRIEVQDTDIQQRFGLDHYYEVEVFVPLERQVRFQDEPDGEGKVFTEYPFVVCVPELPAGMEIGDDIREPVQFAGFFIKLWAYRTEFMSGDAPRGAPLKLQQSPLLIGPTVIPQQAPTIDVSSLTMTLAWMFTGSLILIWILLWWASQRDRQQTKVLFKKHEPPPGNFDALKDR